MIRFKLFAVLIIFEIVSHMSLELTPRNELYYLVAGAFSFLIIPAIANVSCCQLTLDLLALAIAGLITQFVGLLFYYSDFPIVVYNYAISVLLMTQFLRLLIVGQDDGVSRHSSFLYLLCRPNFKRGSDLC